MKISLKNCKEDSDKGYFLEVDVQFPEKLHDLHNDLSFILERMRNGKVEQHVVNMHDRKEYVIHIQNLSQALNHRLVLKKVDRVNKYI